MANKPIIHGRDHRPGGADPIPALSLPVAFLDNTTGFTLATWTPGVYTAVDWELFQTNDENEETFAWPGGGGSTTVALLKSGVYRCVYEYAISGFTFPAAPGYVLSRVTVAVGGATSEELAVNHATAELYEGDPAVGTKWSPNGERVFNAPNPCDLQLDTGNTRAGSVTIETTVMFIYRVGDALV